MLIEEYIYQARILIVDDEPANVRLLQHMLEHWGYSQIWTTTDSQCVLAMVSEYRPDLILLDLMMPHLDGFAILEQLRLTQVADEPLPVLAITADITPAAKRKALSAGARDFLTKPFDPTELLLRIWNILETRFLYMQLRERNDALQQNIATGTHALEQSRQEVAATKYELLEQRRVEAALREARDAADAANRAKSTFLANMSHELRTPLTAIMGYSDILKLEANSRNLPGFIDDLERIEVAGKRLLTLISDILDMAKIEAGKMDLQLETFPVAYLIEEVLTIVQPLVLQHNNRIEVQCADDLGVLTVDRMRLYQILCNLLSNAAKYTHEGLITFAIEREPEMGNDYITFRVADTGIGIAPDVLPTLFQPFVQATAIYGGSGLGLAISQRLCSMMGGNITVSSTPGHGTTFVVMLPTRMT